MTDQQQLDVEDALLFRSKLVALRQAVQEARDREASTRGAYGEAARRRAWTPDEDATLRCLYRDTSIDRIAAALPGRTPHAVRHRAKKLRLKTARTWMPAEDDLLRAGYGKRRTSEMARELKRSPNACKLRAMTLGLASDRYYTDDELELVRRLYPTHTAADIAEALGMSRRSVYRLAYRLGLIKQPHIPDDELQRVEAECAAGGTDADVAARLGCSRERITHVRHRLGIPRDDAAVLEARRRGIQAQLANLGCRNTGELRALAHRNYARENGWPEDLRPREVQIMNALARAGVPMTMLALAEAIGARTDRSDKNHNRVLLTGNGPGGTYTASLARRGLIVRLPKAAQVLGRGRGTNRDLYILSPQALAILAERAEQETSCGR